MFQFTTTTVINSNFEYEYAPTGVSEQDDLHALWSTQEEDISNNIPASLNIKRHLKFKKPNVVSVTKAPYTKPQIAKATLDLASLGKTEGSYRLAMYIKLSQSSANSYYANDLVFKGKPFYIEFVWKNGEEAKDVAKKIKDTAKKYMLLVYEKDLVKLDYNGTKLIINGIDEYQRFERVDIEEYVKDSNTPMLGSYEVVKSAMTEAHKDDAGYDENFTIEQGVEGFGTYQWILKNLRLPTAARTSWTAINADEVPIIGAKYDEYVIRYCVNRGIMGGDAVGEVTKSLTTHVFFVNQNVSAQFEAALSTIAPNGKVEVIWGNDAQEAANKVITEEL